MIMTSRIYLFAVFLLAAACVAPAGAEPPPDTLAPAEKATTTGASAGNTYQQTCGPVRTRFEASDPLARFANRLADAKEANRRAASPLPEGATPVTRVYPVPVFGAEATGQSAVCEVVFDLSATGQPEAIEAVCSDAGFEKAAAEALEAARFVPVEKAGRAIAHKGIVYSLEYCFND